MFAATFAVSGATLAQDLFELNAPSDAAVILHACWITQNSEVTDAQDEMFDINIKTGMTTSGSAGSVPTAVPRTLGGAAFGGTVEANNTTKSTAGTIVSHHRESFNVRAGFAFVPPPELRIMMSPSARLAVELVAAPADAVDIRGTIVFEELGG